jgi:transcriptional regulator with XRE-family HTH domain
MGSETENPAMNPTQAKRLGAYLRKAREKARLSQNRVATTLQVPNTTILRLERGENLAPRPELLSGIADMLGLDLFDVYERAGYAETSDLPTFNVYLRTKYGELPESASDAITAYAERLAKRHGVDLMGPQHGEDEQPEQPITKKGGTRHAKSKSTKR